MKFLEGQTPTTDLTYNDVFLVPQASDIESRSDVDLSTNDGTGNSIPVVVANMNAVAGKRMAETVARRGGIVALPQDIAPDVLAEIIRDVKKAHPHYETPITLTADSTIRDAQSLISKRAHGAVVVVDQNLYPTGIYTEKDGAGFDAFTPLGRVATPDVMVLDAGMSAKESHAFLTRNRLRLAPVVEDGQLIGIMTEKGALRSDIYTPNLDDEGRLRVIGTIGINGDTQAKTEATLEAGADVLMIDTAHGHQQKMIRAIDVARRVAGVHVTIIAGNVVTPEATRDLILAGANIVKVGVGPGAMCTTRMMTGVGRPQFSAVLDSSKEARKHGGHVLADGGIRHPRDVALAIAAGASNVMVGSWLAGTYESAADIKFDPQGRPYKENYGMASNRAVRNRYGHLDSFEQAKKALYEEGISGSKMYLDPEMPGVEDILDHIVAGVRSAATYEGARSLAELHEKAVIGIQSASGYQEGRPVDTSW